MNSAEKIARTIIARLIRKYPDLLADILADSGKHVSWNPGRKPEKLQKTRAGQNEGGV